MRFARGLLVFCFWFILGLLVFCCLRVVSLFPSVCSLVSPFLPLCSRVPCVPFLLRASLSHATGERFGEHLAILAFAVLLVSSAPLRRFSVRACPYRCRKAPMRSMRWLLEVLLRRTSSLVVGGATSWHRNFAARAPCSWRWSTKNSKKSLQFLVLVLGALLEVFASILAPFGTLFGGF